VDAGARQRAQLGARGNPIGVEVQPETQPGPDGVRGGDRTVIITAEFARVVTRQIVEGERPVFIEQFPVRRIQINPGARNISRLGVGAREEGKHQTGASRSDRHAGRMSAQTGGRITRAGDQAHSRCD
jgi:hypothetical protein